MDFNLNEEQKMLQSTLRDFAAAELEPVAAEIDRKDEYPAEQIKKMAGLGLMGLTIPREYGGSGKGLLELCLAVEELSHASPAVTNYLRISLSLPVINLLDYGTEEQKRRYLPPHARGEKLACFALTESGAGSDPASMDTSAVRKDNGYVINGTKLFVSNGAMADFIIVFATVDKSLRQNGITAFIVDRDNPGVSVGKHEDKMGMRGCETVELIFQDCFIPGENRLGEEGRGLKIALEALNVSRVTVGAEAVGISRAACEAALKYSKERQQFGEPIASFQAVNFMLADIATRIDAARLMTYRAADLYDRGLPFIKEAAMAKVFGAEMSHFVTNAALQIHGGYGYIRDYPLERYVRDARILQIYEGTSEMMRLTIARRILADN
ncbi:MAG: acyl-CoA dehydrogenase family protein [Dehalococcoidia bacterium]|jgi:butyryl-CoA dehydrogenase